MYLSTTNKEDIFIEFPFNKNIIITLWESSDYVCMYMSNGAIMKCTLFPPIQCCGTLFFMQKVRKFL